MLTKFLEKAFPGQPIHEHGVDDNRNPAYKPKSSNGLRSMPTTPGSYGSGGINDVYELSSNGAARHGLDLHEVSAQAHTPNPYPAQREWSERQTSELPEPGMQRNETAARESQDPTEWSRNSNQSIESGGYTYTNWQIYSQPQRR